jgi:hypothetical protein
MRYVFNISKLHDLLTFSPPHHTKATNRKLIDESVGARHFALWHGEMEPGGTAEFHVHDEMEQAFIRLRQNTLWLATGMNGEANRAEAYRANRRRAGAALCRVAKAEAGLLRRNSA